MTEKEKILISGATGFISSHLIPKLIDDYEVWALVRYVTGRTFLHDVKTVWADIRDPASVKQAIRLVQPDRFIHLAAISPVSYSYDKYVEVTETNFQGTVILAEACLRYVPHFKQFLFASSSEIYGNQAAFPIPEYAKLRPNSPYAVAKAASDMYLQYMRDAYDFPTTILRPFNTYGRQRNRHFVVERIITQMLEDKKEIRLGDPTPIRDFMYVDDHVRAYLYCLCDAAIGHAFNFCTGKEHTIKELVDIIAELTGWEGEVIWHTIPQRPLDIHRLIGNNEKAFTQLGWEPEYDLHRGLKQTIKNLQP